MHEGLREEACTHDGIQSYAAAAAVSLVTDRDRPRCCCQLPGRLRRRGAAAAFRISQTNKVEKRGSLEAEVLARKHESMMLRHCRDELKVSTVFLSCFRARTSGFEASLSLSLISSSPFPSPVRFAQVSLNRRRRSSQATPTPAAAAIEASNPKGLPRRD